MTVISSLERGPFSAASKISSSCWGVVAPTITLATIVFERTNLHQMPSSQECHMTIVDITIATIQCNQANNFARMMQGISRLRRGQMLNGE